MFSSKDTGDILFNEKPYVSRQNTLPVHTSYYVKIHTVLYLYNKVFTLTLILMGAQNN